MTDRPILFSGPMVRAILEGRKTQTRRTIPNPETLNSGQGLACWRDRFGNPNAAYRTPYGSPGDRLWVRETWGWSAKLPVSNSYDDCTRIAYPDLFAYRSDNPDGNWCWRPSIFMPRWASRITLEIIDVRVQRLQEISEDDAKAEGVVLEPCTHPDCGPETRCAADSYRGGYALLWDSINAKRGFPWSSNPWVWVITFRKEHKP